MKFLNYKIKWTFINFLIQTFISNYQYISFEKSKTAIFLFCNFLSEIFKIFLNVSVIGIVFKWVSFKNDGNFLFDMLDAFRFEIAFQIFQRLILDLLEDAHFEMIETLSFWNDWDTFISRWLDGLSFWNEGWIFPSIWQ